MAVTFNNATFAAGQSTTGAFALGGFTGANTLSGAAPVTINGTAGNPGSTVQVNLNVAGVTSTGAQGTYLGFSAVPNSQDFVYYFNVTGANLVTPVTIGVTPAPALPPLSTVTAVTTTNVTAPVSATPICFVTGTRIRTTRGDVAIEALAIGDLAVTASGAERPIVWIGHRRFDCAARTNPVETLPIRIRAGAFSDGLPQADLVVSPGHRLFIDGRLVTADMLVNGWSIVRDAVDTVDYWHVELETHDVLIAEGMPAESYLDVGNRAGFDNADAVTLLHPDLDGQAAADAAGRCAPLLTEGPGLDVLKARLLDRARDFGARYITDPGVVLAADGLALTPVHVVGGRFSYRVPETTATLTLLSRASVPAQVRPDTGDRRLLGVFVHGLMVDGGPMAMTSATFGAGWHDIESNGWGIGRWTAGEAALPIGRDISFSIEAMPRYPVGQPSLAERAEPLVAPRLRAVA